MDEIICKEKLKERELMRMFEPIEEEMELIQASAKFNHAINKNSQNETELILAYTDDTEKLLLLLKRRIKLLMEITS